MKQRVLSAAVGIVLLILVVFLYDTPVLTAALSCVAAIAVYEVLVSTRYLPPKAGALCALFAGASVFIIKDYEQAYISALALFWGILMICAIQFHSQFSFSQMTVCAFSTMAIPLSLSTILRMNGRIYLVLACVAAWGSDIGAFYAGRAWGKRKLAPEISPNKTVEGVMGGLACAVIAFPAVCYGYWRFAQPGGQFSLVQAVVVALICSAAGVLGDLFASVIKRQSGIKDFGKIMPGHGGIMDRFDSLLFAAPVLYGLLQILPIFGI